MKICRLTFKDRRKTTTLNDVSVKLEFFTAIKFIFIKKTLYLKTNI